MSANFTPVLGGYRQPGAFKFWCQKVLPLVYDDSLSYYELLCKVVSYINSIIGDINFLSNYFESPEFENDISEKLDAMAESGELTKIFDSLKYKTPEMYGGIGDGVTDDTEAIRTMFNHCNDGDLCIFTSRKYMVSEEINITHHFIRCTGWENSEYSPCIYSTATSGSIFNVTGSGCAFDKMMFQGLGRGNTDITGITFNHDNTTANANTDANITNSTFFGLETGIVVYGRNLICDNILFSALRYGIIWKQTEIEAQLRGHIVRNCVFHGVVFSVFNEINNTLPEKNLIIENNVLNGGSSVLFHGYEGNLIICDNNIFIISGTTGGGVCINVLKSNYSDLTNERNVIRNNVIKVNSADYAGVQVTGCKAIIDGNYIENTGRRGIVADGSNCVITNNSIISSVGYGIEGTNGATGIITNNHCVSANIAPGGMKLVNNTDSNGLTSQSDSLSVLGDLTGDVLRNLCIKTGNTVNVCGTIANMSIDAGTRDYFNIPVGFRPDSQLYANGYMVANDIFVPIIVTIYPNGNVRFGFSNLQTASQVGFTASYAIKG